MPPAASHLALLQVLGGSGEEPEERQRGRGPARGDPHQVRCVRRSPGRARGGWPRAALGTQLCPQSLGRRGVGGCCPAAVPQAAGGRSHPSRGGGGDCSPWPGQHVPVSPPACPRVPPTSIQSPSEGPCPPQASPPSLAHLSARIPGTRDSTGPPRAPSLRNVDSSPL